jgi:hypothetical protein
LPTAISVKEGVSLFQLSWKFQLKALYFSVEIQSCKILIKVKITSLINISLVTTNK